MNKKTPNKFQEKMDLTYEQYFRARYERMEQLARELEQVLGQAKAFEIIGKASEKYTIESVKKQMAERGAIKDFEDFKAFVKEGQRSGFSSHIVTVTYPEETPKKFVIRITECLFAKIFKEMNATDLGYIMCCHSDFATSRTYHPKLKFGRTKTLMKGDDCCENIYYWEE